MGLFVDLLLVVGDQTPGKFPHVVGVELAATVRSEAFLGLPGERRQPLVGMLELKGRHPLNDEVPLCIAPLGLHGPPPLPLLRGALFLDPLDQLVEGGIAGRPLLGRAGLLSHAGPVGLPIPVAVHARSNQAGQPTQGVDPVAVVFQRLS